MEEDIFECVTNLVLSEDVYKIMFSFFRVEHHKTEKLLKDRYKMHKKITPEECRVNEYFRMDETSPIIQIHKDIVNKDMKMLFSEPMSINFEVPSRFSNTANHKFLAHQSLIEQKNQSLQQSSEPADSTEDIRLKFLEKSEYQQEFMMKVKSRSRSFDHKEKPLNCQNRVTLDRQKLPPLWEIEKRLQKKPFHTSILKLRELDRLEGPMKKLRLLETVNKMIKDEIWQFWEGIPINEEHLTITQDIKIPLYIYVVLKSKMVNLPAQIRFIMEFTSNYMHTNNLGSNLALYESAMHIVAGKILF